MLLALSPTLSVCPSITPLAFGKSIKKLASFFSSSSILGFDVGLIGIELDVEDCRAAELGGGFGHDYRLRNSDGYLGRTCPATPPAPSQVNV